MGWVFAASGVACISLAAYGVFVFWRGSWGSLSKDDRSPPNTVCPKVPENLGLAKEGMGVYGLSKEGLGTNSLSKEGLGVYGLSKDGLGG